VALSIKNEQREIRRDGIQILLPQFPDTPYECSFHHTQDILELSIDRVTKVIKLTCAPDQISDPEKEIPWKNMFIQIKKNHDNVMQKRSLFFYLIAKREHFGLS
jgi:hypothetical protein